VCQGAIVLTVSASKLGSAEGRRRPARATATVSDHVLRSEVRPAEFLRAHDRGVLALMGPGGVGKSWATQGLDHAGMLPAMQGLRDVLDVTPVAAPQQPLDEAAGVGLILVPAEQGGRSGRRSGPTRA